MALTKNISAVAQAQLARGFYGQYTSLNTMVAAAAAVPPPVSTKTFIDLCKPKAEVFRKLKAATNDFGDTYAIVWHNATTLVATVPKPVQKDLEFDIVTKATDSETIKPYIPQDERFSDTFEAFDVDFVCNGNQASTEGLGDPFTEYNPYIYGKIYRDGTFLHQGSTVPNSVGMIQHTVHNSEVSWTFANDSDPVAGTGFGGLTRVLYKGIGPVRKYGALDATSSDVIKDDGYDKLLKYAGGSSKGKIPRTRAGKHLIAFKGGDSNKDEDDHILIIINEDNRVPGFDIDTMRDCLYDLGFQWVFGMDGSSSVFFFERGTSPTYHIGALMKASPPDNEAALKDFWNLRSAYGFKS